MPFRLEKLSPSHPHLHTLLCLCVHSLLPKQQREGKGQVKGEGLCSQEAEGGRLTAEQPSGSGMPGIQVTRGCEITGSSEEPRTAWRSLPRERKRLQAGSPTPLLCRLPETRSDFLCLADPGPRSRPFPTRHPYSASSQQLVLSRPPRATASPYYPTTHHLPPRDTSHCHLAPPRQYSPAHLLPHPTPPPSVLCSPIPGPELSLLEEEGGAASQSSLLLWLCHFWSPPTSRANHSRLPEGSFLKATLTQTPATPIPLLARPPLQISL